MSINVSKDKMIAKNTPTDTDAYDETVASQEKILRMTSNARRPDV